ncbi:MAG: response regulator [Clostridiales bacterium]|nr:response regulator [Clostridiales bacterium]
MRILIAEDDMVSRKFLFKLLSRYGECDMVIDGLEALDAVLISLKENRQYDLICLDIMMPKVDGVKVLKAIRELEVQKGIPTSERAKIVMTTALADAQYVQESFDSGCEAYAAKPLDTEKLLDVLRKMKLIDEIHTAVDS